MPTDERAPATSVDQLSRHTDGVASRDAWSSIWSLARVESALAGVVLVAALLIGSFLIPMSVDNIAASNAAGERVVASVAEHPDRVRVGYLLWVMALLCVGPATAHLRRLAPGRGRTLTEVGLRLIRVGSLCGALGNTFAPLILSSTVAFDRTTMGAFVHHHETSTTSWVLLAGYALLLLGGIVLAIGLSRARTISRWLAIPLGLAIGAIFPLRFGWQLSMLAVVIAVTLFLAWRASFGAQATDGPATVLSAA